VRGSADRLFGVPILEDLPNPAGKRALVRATLDLPLGRVTGEPMASRRAGALKATLEWLAERGAEVTVYGDAGAIDPEEETRRFAAARDAVKNLLPAVTVADDTTGGGVSAEAPKVIDGLVASHDLFVNDCFQWSYLPVPSLLRPPTRLPSAIGRSVQQDLEAVVPLLEAPDRLFVAVLGGDTSFRRLHRLEGLALRANTVLVGGAMAVPLLQAVGKQPADGVSSEFLAECRRVCGLADRVGHHVQLPVDLVWQRPDGSVNVADSDRRPDGTVVDIGPRSRLRFAEIVAGASTVLWSGALGKVEDSSFRSGTRAVAAALGSGTLVLGGDALMRMLDAEGLTPEAGRVLTATDSALELLKNGDLPALSALRPV
jgi:phosphoglycerate kinase